ncbi:tripartite tricarboxylate transporter permease [Agrobacterium sp.]|uniref:tripartite tricarboxylate transporter permease n=1 Tax=Agrobacterium sp. TaxID=361 RepID=UPI0028A6483F|nr:tripartite tricarboxylate transporter permease [Agrobacterium sp.]
MNAFVDAYFLVFNLETLLVIAASAIFGLFVGALPGLTATMATALLVPLTFYMSPIPAIAAIISSNRNGNHSWRFARDLASYSWNASIRSLCRGFL